MEAYTSFAQVYDLFMDNVPYEEWCDYLEEQLHREGIREGILLDLGCGTGKMTRIMAEKGYDMIGVDNSVEMLDIARAASEEGILYLLQDMQEFELYGTVRAAYCACDSLNYITEEDELLSVFQLVNNYLDPKGVFIFDMNTQYKYEKLLRDYTFAENREECSFIWENYFDKESGINEYDLTLFIKEGEQFSRFQESHYQKSYSLEKILELLEKAGMKVEGVFEAYTLEPPRADSDRITIIAREQGK